MFHIQLRVAQNCSHLSRVKRTTIVDKLPQIYFITTRSMIIARKFSLISHYNKFIFTLNLSLISSISLIFQFSRLVIPAHIQKKIVPISWICLQTTQCWRERESVREISSKQERNLTKKSESDQNKPPIYQWTHGRQHKFSERWIWPIHRHALALFSHIQQHRHHKFQFVFSVISSGLFDSKSIAFQLSTDFDRKRLKKAPTGKFCRISNLERQTFIYVPNFIQERN
jgi:hypothetical protein